MMTTSILQGLLGFVFLAAGGMKLAQSREKIMNSGGKWAEDFAEPIIKVIGAVEFMIALGLVVPRILGFEMYATLTCVAALAAAVIMAGAFFTHLRRKEFLPFLPITGVILALSLLLAYLISIPT